MKQEAKRLYSKMVGKTHEEPARLSISAGQLPDIKDWEVGETYDIKLKMKMTSKTEGGWDGKQPLRAEFQIGNEDESSEEYDDD